MRKNNVTVEILVNDNAITEYNKNGKKYIEGRKGSEYTIKITNHNYNKILIVPTVDGLSTIDGKPGSKNKSPGHIIDAYQTYEIDGWRVDLENVRKFQFTQKDKSYSKKSGKGIKNLGVIGLSCFYEVIKPIQIFYNQTWPDYTFKNNYNLDGRDSSGSWSNTNSEEILMASNRGLAKEVAVASASIGTKMGDKIHSAVQHAEFEKQANSFADFVFYYFERKQLEQMGIVTHTNYNKIANPFPADNFCKEV